MERWVSGGGALSGVDSLGELLQKLQLSAAVLVEVEDTGTAGNLVVVRHQLGRVPRGMRIVNQVTGVGVGPVGWGREPGDPAWTSVNLGARFDVANARVLLEIF